MKDKDGKWTGISIELWSHIADRLKLKYRFAEEPTVQGLIEKTAAKTYDASIAAITVTANRESVLDFSQPDYVTGRGIAVARGGPPRCSALPSWWHC
jgi:ABC-type amino acid transport substrate-binding protein